jgi:CheY-like chemotaxis protein
MSTLFVVDDNELDQSIMKLNLANVPVFEHVSYFNKGVPLIEYLEEHKDNSANLPDVLFIDLRMPGFDGRDVLEALKGIYQNLSKKISVYLLSASILSKDTHLTKHYDFVQGFIPKPITKQNLLSVSSEVKIHS